MRDSLEVGYRPNCYPILSISNFEMASASKTQLEFLHKTATLVSGVFLGKPRSAPLIPEDPLKPHLLPCRRPGRDKLWRILSKTRSVLEQLRCQLADRASSRFLRVD